jgi:hypothetical protein
LIIEYVLKDTKTAQTLVNNTLTALDKIKTPGYGQSDQTKTVRG